MLLAGVAGAILVGGITTYFITDSGQTDRLSDIVSVMSDANEPQSAQNGQQLAQLAPPASAQEQRQQAVPADPQGEAAPEVQPGQQAAPGPGWAVNCKIEPKQQDLECRMSQTVVMRGTRQVLSNVTFLIPADTKTPQMLLQLPLALNLAGGVSAQIDEGQQQSLSFRTCDRSGCYAQTDLSQEVIASLRKGKQLTIEFQNLNEDAITVPLSLDGFADAFDRMQKHQG